MRSVFLCSYARRFRAVSRGLLIGDQDVGGAHQLQVETCVQNVGAGHALVHEARRILSNDFREMGEECDDVVFGLGFDLVDAVGVEFDVFGGPNGGGVFARYHPQFSLGVAGVGLDLKPYSEPGFSGPDCHHFRARIARDHGIFRELWGALGVINRAPIGGKVGPERNRRKTIGIVSEKASDRRTVPQRPVNRHLAGLRKSQKIRTHHDRPDFRPPAQADQDRTSGD